MTLCSLFSSLTSHYSLYQSTLKVTVFIIEHSSIFTNDIHTKDNLILAAIIITYNEIAQDRNVHITKLMLLLSIQ